jgi:hypothetical protein
LEEMRMCVRFHIEEHAVGLAITEALAFGICFAGRATSRESVLGASGVEVICGGALGITDDATAGCGSTISVSGQIGKRLQGSLTALGKTKMERLPSRKVGLR